MSISWEKDTSGLSISDIERRQPYKMQPHAFVPRRRMPWLVCKHCGLVTLRNALTGWCVDHGCNATDHPAYPAAVRRLGATTKGEG